jgi:hypothetical protein
VLVFEPRMVRKDNKPKEGFYFAVGIDSVPVLVFGEYISDGSPDGVFIIKDKNGATYSVSSVLGRCDGESLPVGMVSNYIAPKRDDVKFADDGLAKLAKKN